jgi:hypothetical protein
MDILMDNPFSCACLYSPCVRSVLLERGECGSVTSQRPMRAVWCVRGRRCAVACTWSRVHPIGGHPEPRNRSYNSVVRGRVTVPVRERECRRVCGGICISHDVLRTSTWDQVADPRIDFLDYEIAGMPESRIVRYSANLESPHSIGTSTETTRPRSIPDGYPPRRPAAGGRAPDCRVPAGDVDTTHAHLHTRDGVALLDLLDS